VALVKDDAAAAARQLAVFARHKPAKMWVCPSLALTRPLVLRDWAAFSRALEKDLQSCHQWALARSAYNAGGALLPEKLDPYFTWPHPAMVMAVLATRRGWRSNTDSIWLPRKMLESITAGWNG